MRFAVAGVASVGVLIACASGPTLPSGAAVRVAIIDVDGTKLRDLTKQEARWVQSVVDSCSWRRYWVTQPMPEATLSFESSEGGSVRVDFVWDGLIAANREGHLVSCHLGSTPAYTMHELLAGTWRPEDADREPR